MELTAILNFIEPLLKCVERPDGLPLRSAATIPLSNEPGIVLNDSGKYFLGIYSRPVERSTGLPLV